MKMSNLSVKPAIPFKEFMSTQPLCTYYFLLAIWFKHIYSNENHFRWDRCVTMGLFAQPVLKAYKQYQVNGELTLV